MTYKNTYNNVKGKKKYPAKKKKTHKSCVEKCVTSQPATRSEPHKNVFINKKTYPRPTHFNRTQAKREIK